MSSRDSLRLGGAALAVAAFCAFAPGKALGQANNTVFDDDDDAPLEEPIASDAEDEEGAQFGVLFRLRGIFVPNGLIELFVERAAGGVREMGFGGEVVRRKDNFEISFGIEYEKLEAGEGVWVDKGDELPQDDPDLVEFEDFGWIALDVNFVWTQDLGTDIIALRYGAGIGLGFVLGDVLRTDMTCDGTTVDTCTIDASGSNQRTPEDDIPPVWPVVHLLVGTQIRPVDNLVINLEGGLRSLPMFFIGTSVGYFF